MAAVLAVTVAAAAPAQAVPLTLPPGAPFSVQHWTSASGLPQNSVLAVRQVVDGAVWAATLGGLARFDGVHWNVYDAATSPGCPDSRIVGLFEDGDGSLWFGSEHGVVGRWHRDEVVSVARLPQGAARDFARLPDGRLVCVGKDDVYALTGEQRLAPLYAAPIRGGHQLLRPPEGPLLCCGEDGVHRLDPDGPHRLFDVACRGASAAGDGVVWFATDAGLRRWRPGAALWQQAEGSPGRGRALAVLAARDGSVWFATEDHLGRLRPEAGRADLLVPVATAVRALAEDSSGGIWIGLMGGGLLRLRASEMLLSSAGLELPGSPPQSVVADGHGGWYVGAHTLLRGRSGAFAEVECVGPRRVLALLRDDDDTLWVGTETGLGRLRGDDFAMLGPAGAGSVRALCRDTVGRLWLGTDDGALVFDGDRFDVPAAAASMRGTRVQCIAGGHGSDLWLAGSDEVLQLAAEGPLLRRWRLGEDLPLGDVRAVLPRPGGRVWLGVYGGGFVAIDAGRTTIVGRGEGLLDPFVCAVTPFGRRWLVGGNRGPYLIDPLELDAIVDRRATAVTCRPLAGPYGLETEANGGVQPSASSQGPIAAICCVGGLMLIDESVLQPPGSAPCCRLHAVPSGDQRIDQHVDRQVLLARRDRGFVVRLTAADFDLPEQLRFRWRVLPGSGAWSAPSRDRTVTFAIDAPGDYRFEAEAIAIDDRASPVPEVLDLRVEPLPWERGDLRAMALGLAAMVAWFAFRIGHRRSLGRARLLQRLVDERTADLTSAQEGLEQRVAERTIELRQALLLLKADHERRTQLERELQKLQRMESLGQLAGAVAHDFNNLLTIVLSYQALLSTHLAGDGEGQQLLTHIRDAGERGRRLTQHLLAVASKQAVVPKVVELGGLLREQHGVLQDLLGSTVQLQLEVEGAPLHVRAAQSQLEQILMNLCINARDAMPEGGRVVIRAAATGPNVELRVTDEGVGMTPAVMQRVFEPFFTTKPRERGTGLGLATVYGITKQLLGDVEVESVPGRGTCFRLVFPRTAYGARAIAAAGEPAVLLPSTARVGASLRVLLVEDQDDVRAALRHTLGRLGCVVVGEAGDGRAALFELRRLGDAVDVVLSDVQMPGPAGLQLVRAMRAEREAVPIVFLSGCASSWQFEADCARDGIELLAKPPDQDELLAALRRAHGGGAASSARRGAQATEA